MTTRRDERGVALIAVLIGMLVLMARSVRTVVAVAVAPAVAPQPGAVVLRSDVIRKRLFQVGDTDRLPPSVLCGEARNLQENATTGLACANGVYTIVMYSSGDLDCGSLRIRAGGRPGAQFGHDGYVVDAGDGCWLTINNGSCWGTADIGLLLGFPDASELAATGQMALQRTRAGGPRAAPRCR